VSVELNDEEFTVEVIDAESLQARIVVAIITNHHYHHHRTFLMLFAQPRRKRAVAISCRKKYLHHTYSAVYVTI